MSFLERFIQLDYFGRPLKLRIDGSSKFKTMLGSFVTIIVITVMISLFIQQGQNMIYHKNPNINQMILYSEMAPNLYINNKSLMWAFQILDSNFAPFYDETYFSFKMSQFNLLRNQSGIPLITNEELPLVNCSDKQQDFSRFLTNFESNGLDLAKFMFNQTVQIGGEFTREYFSSLNLKVQLCENSTKNSNCKSKQEIINKLSQGFFQFYYIDKYIDTNNYTIPFQEFFGQYYNIIDPQMYKYLNFYFQKSQVNSDIGFLFESIESQEVILFEKSTDSSTIMVPNNVIIDFYINPSHNYQQVNRHYLKIQDLAATLGGILKIFLILGYLLTEIVNRVRLTERLINHLFCFEENNFLRKNQEIEYFGNNKIHVEGCSKLFDDISKNSNIIEIKSNKESGIKFFKNETINNESNLNYREDQDIERVKKNPNYNKIKKEVNKVLEKLLNFKKYSLDLNIYEVFISICKPKNKKLEIFGIGNEKIHQYFDFLNLIHVQNEVDKLKAFLFEEKSKILFSISEKPKLTFNNPEDSLNEIFDAYLTLLLKNNENSRKILDKMNPDIKKYLDQMIFILREK